ncbi:hypothetical protein [Alkalimarinus alittae]|uniref:Lipoprotein n=1 Tax=Alkalimarinus alittae TaxID=2961619 RepID=A0ABY6N1S9_9ALTE|nr:hypothetical protein [Alkalimarinus alittae]UZE96071.1 hypothetical protein NKI27_18805 [Alkalimarinus alittae]
MLKNTILSCLALSLALLTGCSGHPGTGKWATVDSDSAPFSHIKVDFDGKATIHPTDRASPTLNCYWQATSAEKIGIQCGSENQEEGTIFYALEVNSEKSLATLTFEEQAVGQFKRLP